MTVTNATTVSRPSSQAALRWLLRRGKRGECHGPSGGQPAPAARRLAIVGNPNVGKSLLFNNLTGSHATVSNYPGTTVDVTRGKMMVGDTRMEVIDTPGMYSLLPITEEERVARGLLLSEQPDLVLQVIDARNLERMLPFTLQLIEAGLPLILALNMMDEAESSGVTIRIDRLEHELGVRAIPTIATTAQGMTELRNALVAGADAGHRPPPHFAYPAPLESAVREVAAHLTGEYGISKRAAALLFIQGDAEIETMMTDREGEFQTMERAREDLQSRFGHPLSYVVAMARQREARRILESALVSGGPAGPTFAGRLSSAMMRPLTGIPILVVFLYLGLYQFVGVLGAGVAVGFLEKTVFGAWISPWATSIANQIIPWEIIRSLFVGKYGIITLGLAYAFALILPIVGTFFIMFSIIEDSGYLPRLAMLVDGLFKKIGLSGRAVIPIVLGFGCDTMATIVTRTQETRRERILTTLLLALAIPCSAQLGVIFGILTGNPVALLVWGLTMAAVFMLVGFLAAKVIPGNRPSFYMEIPPLRLPRLRNVISKTLARLQWYFFEVLPVFVIASVVLWAGNLTGLLDMAGRALSPLMSFIGLPAEAGPVFLYGFFRRDFGAAGLYDLRANGSLSGIPLIVAAVTLTLFVPCVAQFSVMLKERGWKTALAIAGFVFPFAFATGFVLNWVLRALRVTP